MADLERALSSVRLYTDGEEYVVVHLPPSAVTAAAGVLAEAAEPFGALLADKDEVTLALAADLWPEFAERLPGHEVAGPYRLITFDAPLSLELVGFLAVVSRALAEAGVPILAFSACARDHVLVPALRFEAAWSALELLLPGSSG